MQAGLKLRVVLLPQPPITGMLHHTPLSTHLSCFSSQYPPFPNTEWLLAAASEKSRAAALLHTPGQLVSLSPLLPPLAESRPPDGLNRLCLLGALEMYSFLFLQLWVRHRLEQSCHGTVLILLFIIHNPSGCLSLLP